MKKRVLFFLVCYGLRLLAMEQAEERFGLLQSRLNQSASKIPERFSTIDSSLFDALMASLPDRPVDKQLRQCVDTLSLETTKLYMDTAFFGKDVFGDYAKQLHEPLNSIYLELEKSEPNQQKIWRELWKVVKQKNVANDWINIFNEELPISKAFFLKDYASAKKASERSNKCDNLLKGLGIFDKVATMDDLSGSALKVLEPPLSAGTVEFIEQSTLFGLIERFAPESSFVQAKKQGMPASEVIKRVEDLFIEHKAQAIKPPLITSLKNYGTNFINPSLWVVNKGAQLAIKPYVEKYQKKVKARIDAGMRPNEGAYLYLYGNSVEKFLAEKESQPKVYEEKVPHFIGWYFNNRHKEDKPPQLPLIGEQKKQELQEVDQTHERLQEIAQELAEINAREPSGWRILFPPREIEEDRARKQELEIEQARLEQQYKDALAPDSPIYWATGSERAPKDYLATFITRATKGSTICTSSDEPHEQEKQKKSFQTFADSCKHDFDDYFRTFNKKRRLPFFQNLTNEQYTKLFIAAEAAAKEPLFNSCLNDFHKLLEKQKAADSQFEEAYKKKQEAENRYTDACKNLATFKENIGSWVPSFLRYECLKKALYRFWGGNNKEQDANQAWNKQEEIEKQWCEKFHAKKRVDNEVAEAKELCEPIKHVRKIAQQFKKEADPAVINGLYLHVSAVFKHLLKQEETMHTSSLSSSGVFPVTTPCLSGEIVSVKGSRQKGADCGYYALAHGMQLMEKVGTENQSDVIQADKDAIKQWKKEIKALRNDREDVGLLYANEIRELAQQAQCKVTILGDLSRIKKGESLELEVLKQLKLAQECLQKENVCSHFFILGTMDNENSCGHWVPCVVHKNEDGRLLYHTADSLSDGVHSIVKEFKWILEKLNFSHSLLDESINMAFENAITKLAWVKMIEKGDYNLADIDRPEVSDLINDILEAARQIFYLSGGRPIWSTAGHVDPQEKVRDAFRIIREKENQEITITDKDDKKKTQRYCLTEGQKELMRGLAL